MFDLVKKLTEIPGPVGREERVQRFLHDTFKEYTDEVRMTNIGNLLAHFPGEGKKVVLNAHADEICYFVQSITDDGFLKVSPHVRPVGMDLYAIRHCTIGQRALLMGNENDLRGVFAAATGHILRKSEIEKSIEYWDIFVDVGASNKQEVWEAGVNVGCPIIWNPTTEKFGKKITGKAMDDRVGLAVMATLAERVADCNLAFDLYMASTVQEETNAKAGSSALAFEERFDIAISLEPGLAGDIPTIETVRMPTKLGDGPALVYKDGSLVYDYETLKSLTLVAERNNIPFQSVVYVNFASDCETLVAGNARPCLITVPCRYTHSPFETIHEEDLRDTVELLYYFLTK